MFGIKALYNSGAPQGAQNKYQGERESAAEKMVKLLSKLFIKNPTEYADPLVRKAYGTLCSLLGIFLNVLLFAGKYPAGAISGSIPIPADAFNNLSDAGASAISLLGFRLSGKKPDPHHPFGHGRIEYISGLAVAALIVVMGLSLIHI